MGAGDDMSDWGHPIVMVGSELGDEPNVIPKVFGDPDLVVAGFVDAVGFLFGDELLVGLMLVRWKRLQGLEGVDEPLHVVRGDFGVAGGTNEGSLDCDKGVTKPRDVLGNVLEETQEFGSLAYEDLSSILVVTFDDVSKFGQFIFGQANCEGMGIDEKTQLHPIG